MNFFFIATEKCQKSNLKMKLIYLKQWGMGRAELIRLILAHVEADYEDCRLEIEEWEDLRPSKYKF